jgi:hypothetical protein
LKKKLKIIKINRISELHSNEKVAEKRFDCNRKILKLINFIKKFMIFELDDKIKSYKFIEVSDKYFQILMHNIIRKGKIFI